MARVGNNQGILGGGSVGAGWISHPPKTLIGESKCETGVAPHLFRGSDTMDRFGDKKATGDRSDHFHGDLIHAPIGNHMGFPHSFGSKEGPKEVSFGGKYETSQPRLGGALMQVRGNSHHPEYGEEGLVDDHFRYQGGLFPYQHSGGIQAAAGNKVERELVPVQRPSFWIESLSGSVHEGSEADGETLERPRNLYRGLYRRFHANGTIKGGDMEGQRSGREGYSKIGLDTGDYQGTLGANSRGGSFGFDNRHCCSTSKDPQGQGGEAVEEIVQTSTKPEFDCEEIGKNSRIGNQCSQGILSSSVVHTEDLSDHEEISFWEKRLGQACSFGFTRLGGYPMVTGESHQVQWSPRLETHPCETTRNRLFYQGMGRRISRATGRRNLDRGRTTTPHQYSRVEGNIGELLHLPESPPRIQSSNSHRQYNSVGQHQQWGWTDSPSNRVDAEVVGMDGRIRCYSGGGSVDSKQVECGTRSGESLGGLGRLENSRLDFPAVGTQMGPPHSGQIRRSPQPSLTTIQFGSVLPWDREGERLRTGLEHRQQLAGPSIEANPFNTPTSASMPSRWYNNYPLVGVSTLVASSPPVENRVGSFAPFTQGVSERNFRQGGAFEGSSLEVSRCPVERISWVGLSKHAQTVIGQSRVLATRKSYEKSWKKWLDFCTRFKVDASHPSPEIILNFLSFLDTAGRGSSVAVVLAAMRAKWKDAGLPDYTAHHQISRMVQGLNRLAAAEKIEKEERLPLPASAIWIWCMTQPIGISFWLWKRDAAIMVLGFRCMRRAGEFACLKRKHLWKKDGWYFLRVPYSKTDQLR